MVCLLPSMASGDQLTLRNGDRVTCEIVKKEGDHLTVKTDQFDIVVAPWDHVVSIVSAQPLHVVIVGGDRFYGALTLETGTVRVSDMALARDEVVIIRNETEQKHHDRLLHSGWGRLWSGVGAIGFSGTAGNSRTMTYTAGLKADRQTTHNKTAVQFSAVKSSALVKGLNEDTAAAVRGGISYDHNVNSRLFLNGFNDYEYDRFQSLDLRLAAGAGLGVHLFQREGSALEFVCGAGYSRSEFSTELANSGELYWGNEYRFKLNSATTLTQSLRLFNGVTEGSGRRINLDLGVSARITPWFSLNASVSNRYLSNPLPGSKSNDFLYTAGFGITFER